MFCVCCVTGTLTENRMTVVAGWFAGKVWPSPPPLTELPEVLQTDIKLNSALNSKVLTPLPNFSSLHIFYCCHTPAEFIALHLLHYIIVSDMRGAYRLPLKTTVPMLRVTCILMKLNLLTLGVCWW